MPRKVSLLLICVVSLLLFGYRELPGLLIVWLFVCGDVACTPLSIIPIVQVWVTSIITFLLPGIFLYSILFKRWKLPFIYISILFGIFLIGIIMGVLTGRANILSSLQHMISNNGLFFTIFSGWVWITIMFVLYTISYLFVIRSSHSFSGTSKKIEFLLRLELIIFILVIVTTTFMPRLVTQAERTVRFEAEAIPFGKIYYKTYTNASTKELVVNSLDSQGNKNQIQVPAVCDKRLFISWDQQKIFCNDFNQSILVDMISQKNSPIDLQDSYPDNQHAWSRDTRYLVLSTPFDSQISYLQVLNTKTQRIEQLVPTPFKGRIKKAIFSPDNTYIAFSIETKPFWYRSEIKIFNMFTKKITDIPQNPVCDGKTSCEVKALQFSNDNSSLLYATHNNTFPGSPKYEDVFALVNLSDFTAKKIVKPSSSLGVLDSFSFNTYDGSESVMYLSISEVDSSQSRNGLIKLNINTGEETSIKLSKDSFINSDQTFFSMDKEWLVYGKREGKNYLTYITKLGSDKHTSIFTGYEAVLADKNTLNHFAYWFPSN